MKTCKTCQKWLFEDDDFRELPEESGLYVCEECFDNPPNWDYENSGLLTDYNDLLDIEPRSFR